MANFISNLLFVFMYPIHFALTPIALIHCAFQSALGELDQSWYPAVAIESAHRTEKWKDRAINAHT